jgi:hypothetical protein
MPSQQNVNQPDKAVQPSIIVSCQCGKSFKAKSEFAGKTAICPACGKPLVIGSPSKAETQTANPTPATTLEVKTTDSDKKQQNPLLSIMSIAIATIGGGVLAQYTGLDMLIPGLSAIIIALLLLKVVSSSRKSFIGAFSVQASQLIWFITAAIFLGTFLPIKSNPTSHISY